MSDAQIAKILAHYGRQARTIHSVESGYRNLVQPITLADGQRVNLMLYKNEAGIEKVIRRANTVADFVARAGLPARRTCDSRIMRLEFGQSVRYAALYHYLPGQTIPWEDYTKDHVKLLGQTLSQLHSILASDAAQKLVIDHDIAGNYITITRRMRRYFSRDDVREALDKKVGVITPLDALERSQKILHICQKLSGQHLLHMDFVRGNILFQQSAADKKKMGWWPARQQPLFVAAASGTGVRNKKKRRTGRQDPSHLAVGDRHSASLELGDLHLSGILDFEKTGRGHPLLDIARTLAFLLVDCSRKSEAQVRKYFLYSGYDKRGASSFRNLRLPNGTTLLEELINLFLLHDFYKFLRHTPYEDLPHNHHFVRTRNLLLARGIVHVKIKTS